ncbi:hypothetical protein QOT17_019434 [Balamuthia mandrillaris]
MKKRATPMLTARTRAIGGPRILFGCSLTTTGLPLSCSCFHVGTQQQARRSRLSSLPSPFSLPPFDRNSRFFSEASLSESERQNLIKEANRYMKEGAKQRAKENLDASLKAFYHALNAIERALEGGGTSPPSLEDQLEHMDILQQIAEVQYEMENFVDAEPNFRLLLAKAKQLLPREKKKEGEEELHPEVVTAMINLASCLSAKVVHKESLAEAERQKILAKGFLARPSSQKEGDDNKEETTGEEEEEVRPDENMLADLREAKELVAKALHFREKIHQSRRHPEVLECIRMMGELSQDVGNHKAAIPYLEEYLAWVDSVGDAQHSHNDTDRFMLLQALHRSYLKSGANNERAAVIKGQLNSIMSELQEEEKRAGEKKDQGENVTIIDLTDPKEMQSVLALAFGSVKKQHAALPEAAKKRLLPASEKQQKQKSTDTNRMKLSKKKETK